jgi:UDPglucose--hexose-1-phosphate uridylyltransferase
LLLPAASRFPSFVNNEVSSRNCPLTAKIFENDFPALLPNLLPLLPPSNFQPEIDPSIESLFASEPVKGGAKVIIFHPRHDLTLAKMEEGEVVKVVEMWKEVYVGEGERLRRGAEVGAEDEGYVQIFEVGPTSG